MDLWHKEENNQIGKRNQELEKELKTLESSYENDPNLEHQQDLEAFQFRYQIGKDGNYQDRFMEAWMLIKILDHQVFNWFSKKRITKEFHLCLEQLGIYQVEKNPSIYKQWTEFSNFYIQCCFQDPIFRNALFGMGNVGDENVAKRIFSEIVLVTKELPERFLEKDVLLPLYQCMINAFYTNVKDAQHYIDQD